MTFEQVEKLLPNGFHDAAILAWALNAEDRSMLMVMLVNGSEGDGSEEAMDRRIQLKASGVSLFFLEPPDPRYPFLLDGGGVNASGCSVARGQDPRVDQLLKQLPAGASTYRFFLEDWNSFLYLAAEDVGFSWG